MPGKIIQSMKRAGVVNPVMLLDEVDKMSMDFRGDPSAALLEVLDPEQNVAFNDHYLDVDYDLSHVMFITTANVRYDIPAPAAGPDGDHRAAGISPARQAGDRPAAHHPEAAEGARPRRRATWRSPDGRSTRSSREYTREAGVRNLEREIASVCRKVAKEIVVRRQKKAQTASEKRSSSA